MAFSYSNLIPDNPISPVSHAEKKLHPFILSKKISTPPLVGKSLGTGATASIYLCFDDTKTAAIKFFDQNENLKTETIINEINIMFNLNSEYCLPAYAWGKHGGYHYIVIKHMSRGDLNTVHQEEDLHDAIKFHIIESAARGIQDMHNQGYVNLDIKTENILIDENYNALVGDFGFSEKLAFGDSALYAKGTPFAVAPEFAHVLYKVETRDFLNIKNTRCDLKKADIYSFGIFLLDFYCNIDIAQGISTTADILRAKLDTPTQISQAITSALEKLPHIPKKIAQLIITCTNDNPADRPTINEIVEHLGEIQTEYFADLRKKLTSTFAYLVSNITTLNQGILRDISSLYSTLPDDEKTKATRLLESKKITLPNNTNHPDTKADNTSLHEVAFFFRKFIARDIARNTKLPTKPSAIIEEYISGPTLQLK